MKNICFLLGIVGMSMSCQDLGKLELVTDLPGKLKEVSGIEKIPSRNAIWTINDSRNPPEIYAIDLANGKNDQTIRLKGTPNIDWEDLAMDAVGTLYVGDFGNNRSTREDLTIYHLKEPELLEKRRYEPIKTTFTFEDQVAYPPKDKKDRKFDVESFFVLNNHFYLFTRHREKAFDGATHVYKLPVQAGAFVAERIGKFKTCKDSKDCQITSAAIDHASGKIALLSHDKVWVFEGYEKEDFLNGKITRIPLGHVSQKESICFKDENTIYIADERSHGKGGNLYTLKLK